ncbi:MAG TPA: glycosyltransferase family 39 protein [Ktedonobacteraceae bacterium]
MQTPRDAHLTMNNLFSQERGTFFQRIVDVMKKVPSKDHLLLVLIMALSAFLRLYQFPSLPAVLHPDEVSAAYNSYTLLLHGTDQWGNPFPIYLPGSGSGQSALLSYLNIPFIKLFGLTALGERFSSVLLSLLTIGIFYAFVKRWYGTRTALIAVFFLGTNPWHIMLSRWSLASNLLPGFLLLGIAFLSYCYTSKYSQRLIPFSLILLALAFYTYRLSMVIIPIFLVLYFRLVGLETLWRNKLGVLFSLVLFFLVAAPFFLFMLDNYVLYSTPWIVQHLPFTVPLLPSNGLAAITPLQTTLASNAQFLISGFNDGIIWNMASGYAAFGLLSFPLVAIGIYYSIKTQQVHANLFLIWLLATLPLLFLMPLTIVRANALFLPFIALGAIGISGLYHSIGKKKRDDEQETPASDDQDDAEEFPTYSSTIPAHVAVILVVLAALTIYNSFFCFYYFDNYNTDLKEASNDGFSTALMRAKLAAYPNEPIYVSDQLDNNYDYTVFFLKSNPTDFQQHSRSVISGGVHKVLHYRNYYFSHDDPIYNSASSFLAILKDNEAIRCDYGLFIYTDVELHWTVERCFDANGD